MKTAMCVVAIIGSIALAQDANRQQNENKSARTSGSSAQPAQSAQTYKGTLMDASCATPGGGTASSAANVSGANQRASDGARSGERQNESDRSATAESSAKTCSVSANTTQFALKLDDGRSVRFDSVGDLRAQQAMKDKKKWNEAAGSGKPIRAKVSGFLSDDKLMVISIM